MLAGLVLFLCCGSLPLRAAAPQPVLITSSSKQISVRGLRVANVKQAPSQSTLVLLDPSVLAVTGETIRQVLKRELGWDDTWRGRVFVELHPARGDDRQILIQANHSPGGWDYRIDLPDEVDPPRLIRAFVEVLLLEFANRHAGDRCVELPPWLVPGLAAHLQAGPLATVVLSPGQAVVQTRVNPNPRADALARLAVRAALTVDQLNWPGEDRFEGDNAAHYDACAHLFVRELLRLRAGPACLREMLTRLHENLNWQTTFFRAFRPHFARMLDVDKWWSLVIVSLTGRDTTQVWPLAESRQRLDDVLYTPVWVRLEKDEVPHDSHVPLQTVLAEWEPSQQFPLLRQKAAELTQLRPHFSPEAAKLADDYRRVLEQYLRARSQASPPTAAHPELMEKGRAIINGALADLDALDRRRERLWKMNFQPSALKSPKSPSRKADKSKSNPDRAPTPISDFKSGRF
ncbi:MAG: hypothetical protein HZA90_23900 [Verrucomicrobia bacterium]|nr:hypothetical protein [Verrucomicrobiota bacterium]